LKLEKERLRFQELELQQKEEELRKSYDLTNNRLRNLNSPTDFSSNDEILNQNHSNCESKQNSNKSQFDSDLFSQKETSVRKEDLNA
jgi:hypothetical protein